MNLTNFCRCYRCHPFHCSSAPDLTHPLAAYIFHPPVVVCTYKSIIKRSGNIFRISITKVLWSRKRNYICKCSFTLNFEQLRLKCYSIWDTEDRSFFVLGGHVFWARIMYSCCIVISVEAWFSIALAVAPQGEG